MADRDPAAVAEQVGGPPRPSPAPPEWLRPGSAARRLRPSPAVAATGLAAVLLAAAWLAAPPMGTDLSAQVARAEFFAAHGFAPVDLRWYGGVSPHGYSLVSPPLMAWLGPRPVGAVAAVVSALALVVLLRRAGVRRPALGGVLGAVCFTGNLVTGRVTFALGVAFGLLALLVLAPALRGSGAGTAASPRPSRWVGGGLVAALAAATSPVAGLFVGLAGTALLGHARLPGRARPVGRPRRSAVGAGGAVLMLAPVVPLAVTGLGFGSGGWMNMSFADLARAGGASLAVAALVPHRPVRTGALLSAAGVTAAYLLPTPVGLNATRLAALFALPLVGACATVPAPLRRWAAGWPRRWAGRLRPWAAGWRPGRVLAWWRAAWVLPVLVALAVWQPPVVVTDLSGAGDPAADPARWQTLRERLEHRQPPGRVEVVPTRDYWEAAHLGGLPLARGWLRQADLDRHPLFFDGTLDAGSYRSWLADNGVSHVVLPRGEVSWVGRAEAELVRQGLPYLDQVWQDRDWVLYRVGFSPELLAGPAVLRDATAAAVVFEVREAGASVLLRVRWSRWLAVSGASEACLAPAGEWTEVRVDSPGTYRVGGALVGTGPRCAERPAFPREGRALRGWLRRRSTSRTRAASGAAAPGRSRSRPSSRPRSRSGRR